MDYVYDIVLNPQDFYYEFYEWKVDDKIINLKKIPIYKTNTEDYLNLKNNQAIIERNTLPKTNKLFLLTNGIEIIGLMLDDEGKILKKSSLIFEEADDILEDKESIKEIKLKYKITKLNKITNKSRVVQEKENYINNYFKNIDKLKDKYTLKYLYYDLLEEEEDDINKIYLRLKSLAKENINKLYDSIKQIDIELKNK